MEQYFPLKLINFEYFSERPGPGIRFVVRKNLDYLLTTILGEIKKWSINSLLKYKGFCQLYTCIVCAEDAISESVDKLIRFLYSNVHDEDKLIRVKCLQIAELIGFYVKGDILIPMMMDHLGDKETKSVPTFTKACLAVFGQVLSQVSTTDIRPHAAQIVSLVTSPEFLETGSSEVLHYLIEFIGGFLHSAKELCSEYRSDLFNSILFLASTPIASKETKQRGELCMGNLAKYCELENISLLFEMELEQMLESIWKEYSTWGASSGRRFAFDMLLRRASRALTNYWDKIILIISCCCELTKDYEVRFDMLTLLEHFIQTSELREALIAHSQPIFKQILIPCCVWRSGKPTMTIRRAGIICMRKMIINKLIPTQTLFDLFGELEPISKGCLDDDWDPQLRFAGCEFYKEFIGYLGDLLGSEEYGQIYPALIERMDDSQNGIRISIAHTLAVFFQTAKENWSNTLYEYLVKSLFVHLDDSEGSIRQAVGDCLEKAAPYFTPKFIKIAEENATKAQHPVLFNNLLQFAKSL